MTVKFPAPTLTPLNFTSVAPVNPVPTMTTLAPTRPWIGVKLVIVAPHVKSPAEVAVPLGVVIEIGPVPGQAPAGTVARIWATLSTVNVVAAVPLN